MKPSLVFILLTTIFSSLSLNAGIINIAVAANVSYAIEDLKKEFNKSYPDTKVRVTLGSSGKLTAQIKRGAPYQLFMSANMMFPQALYDEGFTQTKPLVYAQGTLSILSSKKRDFALGIDIVLDENIKKIAIANPKTAPYGKATVEALKNAKLYKKVIKKFVYAESISQTVSYSVVATDLGFIASSSLYSNKMKRFKKGINWIEVDPKLYAPINQGVVILKENVEVRAFYQFLQSPSAKIILKKFGYKVL